MLCYVGILGQAKLSHFQQKKPLDWITFVHDAGIEQSIAYEALNIALRNLKRSYCEPALTYVILMAFFLLWRKHVVFLTRCTLFCLYPEVLYHSEIIMDTCFCLFVFFLLLHAAVCMYVRIIIFIVAMVSL